MSHGDPGEVLGSLVPSEDIRAVLEHSVTLGKIQSGFLALAVAESSQSGLSFLPSLSLLLLEQLTNRLFRGYLCKQEGFHKERHLSFYKENARSKFSSSRDSCIPHEG